MTAICYPNLNSENISLTHESIDFCAEGHSIIEMEDSRQQRNINIWVSNQQDDGIQVRSASMNWIGIPDAGHVAILIVGGRKY